ncbi:Ribosome maturation protein SDO1 [uncultured archaeon]|nr:Ribosome maturation protein SDO1 [uncultured archaeon]
MVSLDEAVIVRLKSHGETFEIYVDPDLALSYKGGEPVPLGDVLAVQTIFKDAGEGDKASAEAMTAVFGSTDFQTVVSGILKKGELHLTTEQKKKMSADRWKQVVDIIARNAINPQNGKPHPPARIDSAMAEARVEVTINKSAKEQVEDVLHKLKPLLPIRFEKINAAVKASAQNAPRIYQILREFGDVRKEEWVGSECITLLEIPAGVQDEFSLKLNNATHGDIQIKFLRDKDVPR